MVQTYRALVQSLGVDYRAYTEEKKTEEENEVIGRVCGYRHL